MMWQCSSYSFDSRMPIVMGILNVTPDSFSDGGRHNDFDSALAHARAMLEAGAKIIDVGGESTRPGSAAVSVEEELSRTVDVVRALAEEGVCVSIDTRHAEVARACVEAGASIINDVSGFRDPAMVEVAASCDAGCVIMHMKGEPATMQENPTYDDVVAEVKEYLAVQAAMLEAAGVSRGRICPRSRGPGFRQDALADVSSLCAISTSSLVWGIPPCAPYRASAISERRTESLMPAIVDIASAAEALMACELGASVVRAHNVEETMKSLADLRPYALIARRFECRACCESGRRRRKAR